MAQTGNSAGLNNAFLNEYFATKVVPEKNERSKVIATLNLDLDTLFDFLYMVDDRFSKDVIRLGSSYQGLKVEHSDEFDFTLCLNYITIDETWIDSPVGLGCFYGFRLDADTTKGYHINDEEFWRKAHTAPQPLPNGTKTRLHNAVNERWEIVSKSRPLDPPALGYKSIAVTVSRQFAARDLTLKFEDLTYEKQPGSPQLNLIPFLVKRQLKLLIAKALSRCRFKGKFNRSTEFHGPALNVKYKHPSDDVEFTVNIDIAPAVRCMQSFERLGVNWPRPNSRWPPEDIVDLIKQKGVLYVAKKNFYWRMVFAECEKVLCTHCDSDGGCRKKVHRLMKYFHKKFWRPQSKPQISTYIVKNVWMLEMERLPDEEDWKQNKLNVRLFDCIRSLLGYVYGFNHHSRPLPLYFNPADNLLDGRDKPQLEIEYDKIQHFCDNPREYLK